MGLRDTLNEKPGLTTAVTAVVVAVTLAYTAWQMWPVDRTPAGVIQRVYYTPDLGKTLVPGDYGEFFAPADAGGANVRAHVYKWPGAAGQGAEPFAAWLERLTPEQARAYQSRPADQRQPPRNEMADLLGGGGDSAGHEVARPGEDKWFALDTPIGRQIAVSPSKGNVYAVPVDP